MIVTAAARRGSPLTLSAVVSLGLLLSLLLLWVGISLPAASG